MGATTMDRTEARTLTAFGETKTLAAWAMDRRAAVYAELIGRRLDEGMSPEQAISVPLATVERGPVKLLAWGERKTFRDWADDVRCRVSLECLRSRIDADWPVEEAISRPAQARADSRADELVEAWGETRTIREWAADERATSDAKNIRLRLDRRQSAEWAIGGYVRARTTRPDLGPVEAWGEAKTVRDWAIDPRAGASMDLIRYRLDAGWAAEEAIGQAVKPRPTYAIEAFGETKTVRAWSRDPRSCGCRMAIDRRLKSGMDPEAAITTPVREVSAHGFTAFGETKTLEEWTRDPRCSVTEATLSLRRKQGMSPEEAITRPSSYAPRPEEERIAGLPSHTRAVSAFGERRSLNGWLRDPRCAVLSINAIRDRIEQGWSAEEAISTPSTLQPALATAWGETKSVAEWARNARCAVTVQCLHQRLKKGWEAERAISTPSEEGWEGRSFEAFGETRTLREWSEDARCRVTYKQLQDRLRIHGMRLELALVAPTKGCKRGRYGEMATAFGETRLLGEWMGDSRCAVSRKALGRRLRLGWALEKAMTTPEKGDLPVNVNGKFLEAFGERRNIRQWSRNARCAVSEGVLKQRLDRGWDVERALTTETLAPGAVTVARGPRGAELRIAAFGETKRIGAWGKDPRCAVRTPTLRLRIEKGWDPEEAIATAPGGTRGDAEAVRRAKGIKIEPPEGAVLAWGERKSVADWADDPRAAVAAGHLRHRLGMGWEPERAISTPVGEPSLRLMAAFGETKSLSAWQADARCVVSMWTVRHRLAQGWGLEKALITEARDAREGGLTAFGETKTLAAWALDPRCEVGPGAIGTRLKEGLSPEEAIARPSHLVRQGEGVAEAVPAREAVGARLALSAWLADPRCAVGGATLRNRIAEGMSSEEALTRPGGSPWKDGVTAWGETKSVAAWARDPRCTVQPGQVAVRLGKGMSPEDAIGGENRYAKAEPLGENRPRGVPSFATLVTAWGETKTPQAWARDARCPVSATTIRVRLEAGMEAEAAISSPPETTERTLTAWGETKTAAAWLNDPRCVVTSTGLFTRLARGMAPELALSAPTAKRGAANLLTAFGESKALLDWVDDPRCRVTYPALQKRLLKGAMTPEEALTRALKKVDRERFEARATAFGETKTVSEWIRDARAAVPEGSVRQRLNRGWPLEDALTLPEGSFGPGKDHRRMLTAFGETKTLKDWGRDPRCVVAENTVAYRIDRGWTMTDALTTPQLREAVGRGNRRCAA